MKARYIGGESEPGSQETIVFGVKVKCGAVFDVPPQFERKAQINPWIEVLEEIAPPTPAVEDAQAEAPAPKTRKRKAKDDGNGE